LGKKDKSKLKKISPQQKVNFIGFVFKANRIKKFELPFPNSKPIAIQPFFYPFKKLIGFYNSFFVV